MAVREDIVILLRFSRSFEVTAMKSFNRHRNYDDDGGDLNERGCLSAACVTATLGS